MAETIPKRSSNFQQVASAETNDADRFVKPLLVDPSTGRLLVDASVTVSGLPTAVIDGEAVNAADYGTLVLGTDGSNYQILKTDSAGILNVHDIVLDNIIGTVGAAAPSEVVVIGAQDSSGNVRQPLLLSTNFDAQAATDIALLTTTRLFGYNGTTWDRLRSDTTNGLDVDVTRLPALAAGTNNIGDVDILSIAAGDNNIGNVDIVSGTITTVSAVTAITNALPAGTNALGKLLPPDVDVTAHTNYARKYYTNSGAVTDGIVWSPAAGKRWHVVTMYIQTSAAATITLEDDKAGGDVPVWKGEIAANSGVTLSFTEKYPMASGEDAADLIVTTSAGNVYITCVGYEI